MCGISGFVGEGDHTDLQRMNTAQYHRGPDGEGQYHDQERRLYLGHRRLAILDLAGGQQPMWNEDGQVGVVFNGEIYNFTALRERLEKCGHRFQSSHSDTEVLVHGYEEWGEQLPELLSGMFAFAIYDRRQQRLFLARDRMGKKPLFYTCQLGVFAFASELSGLLAHRHVKQDIDAAALRKFFAYGFLPAPNSLYRGVKKLPGGYTLTYDLPTGAMRSRCYWRFAIEPAALTTVKPEEILAEELRHLLGEAVKTRLRSDVPIGVFLSGGIDSSATLALAGLVLPSSELHTFSIGFQEPSFDESEYARRVATHFGSQHHERLFSLEQARALADEVVNKLDEPLGDASLLPTYLLSRFARERITVALGGDGGDELFAGYDPFHALRWASAYQKLLPKWIDPALRFLVGLLPLSSRNMSLDFKLRRALRGVKYPSCYWNPIWLGAIGPEEVADLFAEPTPPEELFSEALTVWNESASKLLIDRTLEFYTRLYLQDDILVKLDRATMMTSLEGRSPFLDNAVVDFARRLPAGLKYRNGVTKYILKKAMKPLLPNEVLQRRKKGFGVPLLNWLRDWPAPNLTGLPGISQQWLREKWSEHQRGKADHRQLLWCSIALQRHARAA